ncbi:MAG: phosphoribosyl-ATP diphosphatase [Halofilum sp. (in: g-proteobacteria)]
MNDDVLHELGRTLAARRGADPDSSYTAALLAGGDAKILKKVGEEATEVILAGSGEPDDALVHEVADLWYHTLVLLAHRGLSPDDVLAELARRTGVSGHEEKAARADKARPGD